MDPIAISSAAAELPAAGAESDRSSRTPGAADSDA
eukprot:COSAG06_NODE_68712_length_207_cov_415.944444_1_plen_34_part_10